MKKLAALIFINLLCCSILNSQNTAVKYKEAKNYFIKNSYPEKNLHLLKITESEVFENIFGMATLMGKNGQPTPIDFSKSFVIALIDDTNNTTEKLTVKSIKKDGDQINLQYILKKNETPSSANYRFCTIVIIDKKYMGTVKARQYTKTTMVGDDLDELGCKPSTGYVYSLLENDCVAPWNSSVNLEMKNHSLPVFFNKELSKLEIMGLHLLDQKYPKNIILLQENTHTWSKGDWKLIEIEKGNFQLTHQGIEIAKGKKRS